MVRAEASKIFVWLADGRLGRHALFPGDRPLRQSLVCRSGAEGDAANGGSAPGGASSSDSAASCFLSHAVGAQVERRRRARPDAHREHGAGRRLAGRTGGFFFLSAVRGRIAGGGGGGGADAPWSRASGRTSARRRSGSRDVQARVAAADAGLACLPRRSGRRHARPSPPSPAHAAPRLWCMAGSSLRWSHRSHSTPSPTMSASSLSPSSTSRRRPRWYPR